MSRLIALVSRYKVDLNPLINTLRQNLDCVIIDTLSKSFITHCNIKTGIVVVDPMSGPYNTTFDHLKYGIRQAKEHYDPMTKMVSLHLSNTKLLGSTWTDMSIPNPIENKYTILLGLYTKEDIERVIALNGLIIVITDENRSHRYFEKSEVEIETIINSFDRYTYRTSLSNNEIIDDIRIFLQ